MKEGLEAVARGLRRRSVMLALAVAGVLGLAMLVGLMAAPTPVQAGHAGPLAGQWHLDEIDGGGDTTPDSSGHGLDATTSPQANLVPGRFGNAYEPVDFSRIRVLDHPVLEPPAVTAIAWVRRSGSPGDAKYVLGKGDIPGCNGSSYALYSGVDGTGNLRFQVYDGTANRQSPAAGPLLWDGAWHMVAGTYDGTRVRLYVDGVEVGEGTPAPGAVAYGTNDDTLSIGSYPNDACGDTFFPGAIDEPRVYGRALSAAEIARLAAHPGPDPPVLEPDAAPGGSGGGDGGQDGGGAGGGGPGGGGPGGSEPGPIVPLFTQARRGAAVKGAWLSAAESRVPAGVEIAAFEWDFDGNGVYEIPCGGLTPAVTRAYTRTGTRTVGLRVTDTAGRAFTTRQTITVERGMVNRARGAQGVFDCSNPGANNQPDRADCVKTFGFSIISVNSRGRAEDCFEIRARPRLDVLEVQRASAAQAGPAFLSAYYHARVRGPVAINGLYVPVPTDRYTEYDSGRRTIGVGRLPLRFGSYLTHDVDLSQRIEPDRSGKYRLALPSLKAPDALGFLPVRKVGGHIDLIRHASLSTVLVGLPNVFTYRARGEPAEVGATIRSDNVRGADLDGITIGPVPELLLGPLTARKLRFAYSRSEGTWTGGGDLGLTGPSPVVLKASPPPPDFGFGLRRGRFWYAGAGAEFPVPAARPVLFPGLTLKNIGVSLGIDPIRLTGIAGIAAGELIEVDGALFLGFATPSQPYDFPSEDAGDELAGLGGRRLDTTTVAVGGSASVRVPGISKIFPHLDRLTLLRAHFIYQWPGYVEYAGNVELKHKDGYFSIKGGLSAFADASSRTFNLEGSVEACLKKPITFCAPDVGAVVSSRGLGFCTIVPVPTPLGVLPIPAGVGFTWGASFPDLMVFTCSIDKYREVRPGGRAAQAGTRSFSLPRGLPAAMVRVRGAGGEPPRVVLTGPGGEVVRVPDGADEAFDSRFAVMRVAEDGTTVVGLKQPQAGRWTVSTEEGSPSIAGLAVANGLREPRIRVSVTGRGRTKVLRYAVRDGAGWRIVLAERGARTSRVLGTADGRRGRLRFVPGPGRAGRRTIVARIEAGGRPVRTRRVGGYRAAGTPPPARVRGLRVLRRGQGLVVRWRRAPRAARYAVTLVPQRGEKQLRTTRGRRVRFPGVRRRARGRVIVTALDGGGIAGRSASARWAGRAR